MRAERLFAGLWFIALSAASGLSLGAPVLAQGYAGLGATADGYAPVVAGHVLQFPRDHGAHPDYRIEWWYVTAALSDEKGMPMGAQWTLFRLATRPEETGTLWSDRQFWMAHAAVTTPNTHRAAERFARGGVGQAGVTAAPFSAWIDNWAMISGAGAGQDPLDRLSVTADDPDFGYDLELVAEGPLVLNGDQGFSVKSDAGQASYYYSQPFYRVTGEIILDGRARKVSGRAWLDREWSSQPLGEGQDGWDWLSLHLDSGAKVMAYRLREGGAGRVVGTWIEADGQARPLSPGDVDMEPLETVEADGRTTWTAWRVLVPGEGVDVRAQAVNADSWMGTQFDYWEGPVAVSGSHTGTGYLEMTGDATP